MKTLIEGVTLWNPDEVIENVDVVVENGVVASIRPSASQAGWVLMPAGVDAQAHLRLLGQDRKETPETGVLAALRGGYGAVLNMPNTQPTIDSVAALKDAQERVRPYEQKYGVRVFHSAAISFGLKGEALTDLAALADAGAIAFTDDGKGVQSDELMARAFRAVADLGMPLLQHAEFDGHGGVLAPGPAQRELGVTAYPDKAEVAMVERDCRVLCQAPQARYHVLHVSSRGTLEVVKQARETGLRVTCEVSPHHLYFSSDDIDPKNPSFKMNPPIRSEEDRQALVRALADGTIDFVATDHAPHEDEVKTSDLGKAAFGTIGLETALGVLLELKNRGLLTEQRLVQVFSTHPASFLGLDRSWGRIEAGQTLRAILIDPKHPGEKLTPESFSSLSKNSCFLGCQLPGKILKHYTQAGIFSF